MKVVPRKDFRELAHKVQLSGPEAIDGFIDPESFEPIVPEGSTTRVKLHELGHEKLGHLPKALEFYGKMEPWRQMVDDEIEAEIWAYKAVGKKITPKVGVMALEELIHRGWTSYNALSLVIGRLRHYGIEVSYVGRMDLVHILDKAGYEGLEELEI